jgi:diaminohydroxyphosphoribosylaminopyrimidine deaminase/5-amino-6-(5-phosphoribosylamino)uracil reductase
MVGAVVISATGIVVGQGHHARAGEAHAEVVALDAAGDRARGATLYCTLEPCCHVGRTGPCVERIVAAGITRVVASMRESEPPGCREGLRVFA